jgi:hypothetical protein
MSGSRLNDRGHSIFKAGNNYYVEIMLGQFKADKLGQLRQDEMDQLKSESIDQCDRILQVNRLFKSREMGNVEMC